MTERNERHSKAVGKEFMTEITISFRDAHGERVEVALDRTATASEREQVETIAREISARAARGAPALTSHAPRKIKGCDDGELFRSWALTSRLGGSAASHGS